MNRLDLRDMLVSVTYFDIYDDASMYTEDTEVPEFPGLGG